MRLKFRGALREKDDRAARPRQILCHQSVNWGRKFPGRRDRMPLTVRPWKRSRSDNICSTSPRASVATRRATPRQGDGFSALRLKRERTALRRLPLTRMPEVPADHDHDGENGQHPHASRLRRRSTRLYRKSRSAAIKPIRSRRQHLADGTS